MKKRIVTLFLCAVMLMFSAAACQDSETASPATSDRQEMGAASAGTTAPAAASAPDDAAPSDSPAPTTGAPDAPETQAPSEPEPVRDTINVAITSDSGTLDAANMTGGVFSAVASIMEPLWDVTEENEIIMVLAEEVEQISDTQFIVHLREGVKFSNGNPLTAEDVVFSIGLHYAAGATGMPRVQTIDPEQTTAIDDTTLDMRLLAPSIANWQILTQFLVYDQESYDASSVSQHPIGTGPYVLKEYIPNSSTKLERRDDYWGEKPDIKYLNFYVLAEPAQRVNALETGQVDIAPIAIEDVEYVKGLSGFYVDSRYTGLYVQLGFNFGEKSKFYKNTDARRAVAHAIDAEVIVNVVYLGQGEVMHAAVPTLCFDYEDRFTDMDDTYKLGYDPELASQLAESSGLKGQTIKMMTDGSATAVKSAEVIQNMLAAIGVSVEINNYDPGTVWLMAYDPDADYDFTVGTGMAPNRVVGDLLYNGVRYSPTMTIPEAFDDNVTYLEKAPFCMSTLDETERSDLLYEMLGRYENNVLSFALCNTLVSNAYSSVLDPSSIVYTFGTVNVRFLALKFAS